MAARADKIIMRNTARGLVPAHSFDAELLARLPIGCDVEVKRIRKGRSGPLAGWWLLCSRVADCLDEQHTSRSVSNNILLDLNMVEAEVNFGGGTRREPMSLTDFSDEQLVRLLEAAKRHVVQTILPGIDIDALMKTEGQR